MKTTRVTLDCLDHPTGKHTAQRDPQTAVRFKCMLRILSSYHSYDSHHSTINTIIICLCYLTFGISIYLFTIIQSLKLKVVLYLMKEIAVVNIADRFI